MSLFRNADRYRWRRTGGVRRSRWRTGYGSGWRNRYGDRWRRRERRGTGRYARSGGLRGAARFGFIARGIAYIVIGILAFMLAVGTAQHEPTAGGALAALAGKPLGYLLLWILVFGFAALAAWRLAQAAAAPATSSNGPRLRALGLGILYAIAFFVVLRFVVDGRTPQPSDAFARDVTARILGWSGGQVVVLLLGLAILAGGVLITLRGIRLGFLDDLRMGWMTRASREAVIWLGRIGYLARGVIVIGIGLAAVVAAANYEPANAKGVDAVLHDFADSALGPWLLIAVALGLMAFGILSFLQARYRRTYGGVPV
ncbi:DUF1206 domain-containing protein [Nocardia sp. NPDC051929]|uniref:DUF1206 domain-containing protein n=1 Tax=Nocardia sp. NPDC051929 TaxID=3364327 RepID=UPI0037CBC65E